MIIYNLIYLIEEKKEENKIENSKNIINDFFSLYGENSIIKIDKIIINILINNYFQKYLNTLNITSDNFNLKLSDQKNKIKIYKIDISKELEKKSILEYEEIKNFNNELNDIIIKESKDDIYNNILTIKRKYHDNIKELLIKNKIKKNILFNYFFDKPTINLINEYNTNFNIKKN